MPVTNTTARTVLQSGDLPYTAAFISSLSFTAHTFGATLGTISALHRQSITQIFAPAGMVCKISHMRVCEPSSMWCRPVSLKYATETRAQTRYTHMIEPERTHTDASTAFASSLAPALAHLHARRLLNGNPFCIGKGAAVSYT